MGYWRHVVAPPFPTPSTQQQPHPCSVGTEAPVKGQDRTHTLPTILNFKAIYLSIYLEPCFILLYMLVLC